MKSLLVVVVLTLISHSWAQNDNVLERSPPQYLTVVLCHFVVFGEFTYEEAKQACLTRHAYPAFFVSASHEQYVRQVLDWKIIPGILNARYFGGEWANQAWIGIVRKPPSNGGAAAWGWDNSIYPGLPPAFRPPWSKNLAANDVSECALIRKFDWITGNCTQRKLAGSLCTTATRFPSEDSAAKVSNNYCDVPLLPPSPNNLVLPAVIVKTYFIIQGSFNFEEAKAACARAGADTMITARSPEEIEFQLKNLDMSAIGNQAWIGLQRVAPQFYVWVDGLPNTKYDWLPGEENNAAAGACIMYDVENESERQVGTTATRIGWRHASCTDTRTNTLCENFKFP